MPGVVRCDHSIIFDIQLFLRAGEVFTLDDVRGFFPDGIDVVLFHEKSFESIVGAPNDGGFSFAVLDGVHRRQRLVLNGNGVHRFSELVTVWMSKKQNRLFRVIHRTGGEARLIVQNQGDTVFPRDVSRGNNNIFVPDNVRAKSDFSNFAARDGAAHGCAVKHSGQNHVIDVARRSGDFVPTFLARHRCPDDVMDGHNILAAYSV